MHYKDRPLKHPDSSKIYLKFGKYRYVEKTQAEKNEFKYL